MFTLAAIISHNRLPADLPIHAQEKGDLKKKMTAITYRSHSSVTTSYNARKEQLHTAGKEKRFLHLASQGTPTEELTFPYPPGDILTNNRIPPLKSCFEYQEIALLSNG